MNNRLNRKKDNVVDIEARGEEAKRKRVEACMAEVNAVLEKHRCDVQCAVQISEQIVPLTVILNLPNRVQIISK